MDAFFRPRKPCVLPCGHQTEKTLGVVWGSWTSSPGPPPLGHSTRRRGRGRRGGTGDRSCPTWTIPAVGGRQAWAGTGPPSPTCPEALSDTSLWAERRLEQAPGHGEQLPGHVPPTRGTVPGALGPGHWPAQQSLRFVWAFGSAGATRQDTTRPAGRLLPGACSLQTPVSWLHHEGGGAAFPVTPGDHTVGRQPGLLTPGTISPHPPPHRVLLKQRPCCVRVSRPGHERKPKTGQSGEGVKGSHARGALVFCRRKRRSARKGQKQENTTPTSRHVSPPPACASPRPQLMTKEKHAATLTRLGKCRFTNSARSSGLTP